MIDKKGNIAIAIAVVVAGLIIALAVMLTNNSSGNPASNDNDNGSGATDNRPSQVNPVDENDWVKGNRDASIKIVEYSDTECPFCSVLHPTLQRIVDEYDDQVAWAYRHFPIAQLHPIAPTVAVASECVGELGGNDAFWNFTDKIYELSYINTTSENPESLSEHAKDPTKLTDYAVEAGVNADEFNTCLEEGRYEDDVRADYENAVAAGGQGTPFNIIILDEELDEAERAAVDGIASQVNRPDRVNLVVSDDGKHVSLSGAMPYEIWKGILDAVLN